MPRVIVSDTGDALALDDLAEALATTPVDPADEDAFATLGPLLAGLGRNQTFLADLAIRELEERFAGQAESAYGAQVLLLRPPGGRFLLRANFWPSRDHAAVRASGGSAFFYDHAHDHNFSFLTVGYLGSGYWSDYYEHDPADRLAGDPAGLRFVERSRLDPGKVLLYRKHRDVHAQLPPDDFSVSLNILAHEPAQHWRTQYRFDLAADRVAEPLTVAPSEALVTLAVHFGGDEGDGLVTEMLRRHPAPRMRRTALTALASAAGGADARAGIYAMAADDPDPVLARHARARLAPIPLS